MVHDGLVQDRQARPLQPQADRSVSVEGRLYRVKIRPRFHPSREVRPALRSDRGSVGGQELRWLFWTLPAKLLRRLVDRRGWTITVYEVRKGLALRRERHVYSERVDGSPAAAQRADALVEELEDRIVG